MLIGISDGTSFLVVPQEWEAVSDEELLSGLAQSMPEKVAGNMGAGATVILRRSVDNIYLVASATMDMFRALDGLDHIRLSGTNAKDNFTFFFRLVSTFIFEITVAVPLESL